MGYAWWDRGFLLALEARLNSSSGVGVEVGELRRKLGGISC